MNTKTFTSEVPLDYFLYSCFEFEKLCKLVPAKLSEPTRWQSPELSLCEPESAQLAQIESQISNIASWYRSQFKTLLAPTKLDYASIGEQVTISVYIGLDLSHVVSTITGAALPEVLSQAQDSSTLWTVLRQRLSVELPELAPYLLQYLSWAHAAVVTQEIVPGSRPPVGRNSPFFRPGRNEGFGGPSRGRPPGNRDRAPSAPPPPPPNQVESAERPERTERPSRPPRPDRPNRPEQHENNRYDKRPPRQGFDPKRGPERSRKDRDPEMEKDSLEQVRIAARALDSDPSLAEYRLPPSNSYYRRLQHQEVKKEGYFSISDGRGPDRGVVVVRNQPEHSEAEEF